MNKRAKANLLNQIAAGKLTPQQAILKLNPPAFIPELALAFKEACNSDNDPNGEFFSKCLEFFCDSKEKQGNPNELSPELKALLSTSKPLKKYIDEQAK